jgi:hypothetical protein
MPGLVLREQRLGESAEGHERLEVAAARRPVHFPQGKGMEAEVSIPADLARRVAWGDRDAG